MNLDDTTSFAERDPGKMLAEIEGLPDQLQAAWNLGNSIDLPEWRGIRKVLVAGMGGSAIGADLVAAYVSPICQVPVIVHRNYGLPTWAKDEDTLVVASSHSGNTEETLSTLDEALKSGARCLVITTGGKLEQVAERSGLPLYRFEHKGQPRSAVGFSFGLLLAALYQINLLPDLSGELEGALKSMRRQLEQVGVEVPTTQNPAKRLAGQLVGRLVTVFGADILEPVARRWKGQINELAKAWAGFEALPEADHNTLTGVANPEELLGRTMALFLRAPSYHPRNQLRVELTKRGFMLEGINTDFVDAQGETRMEHLWTAVSFGDFMAYYLAMAYGMDPTPIPGIQNFKMEMKAATQELD